MKKRLIVIGAGPIGLSAALLAEQRGLDVTVLEQGAVGEALRRWGNVRFFSPLGMNLPSRARAVLGAAMPKDDALLTGPQMIDDVLAPLAASAPLKGRILTTHRVISAGRLGLRRGDLPGHPIRAERPFRLLARTPHGDRFFETDFLVDAGGVLDRPNVLGTGGLSALGEAAANERIIRHLGTLESRRGDLAGRHLLLVGHGHSAANAILILAALASESAGTRVTWATRSAARRPCVEVAADPLTERARVTSLANDLASAPPEFLTVERRCSVESLESVASGAGRSAAYRVGFTSGRAGEFDEIAAFTGYRPDVTYLSELPLEISPVTEGVGRLSAALSNVTDCLSVPEVAPEDLQSGEPGFHIIGAKSFGRSPAFLLRTGLRHLETIIEGIPL